MPRSVAGFAAGSAPLAPRRKAVRNDPKPTVATGADARQEGGTHCCGLRYLGSDEGMILESGWFQRLIKRL